LAAYFASYVRPNIFPEHRIGALFGLSRIDSDDPPTQRVGPGVAELSGPVGDNVGGKWTVSCLPKSHGEYEITGDCT
jgi:hypothetical protein